MDGALFGQVFGPLVKLVPLAPEGFDLGFQLLQPLVGFGFFLFPGSRRLFHHFPGKGFFVGLRLFQVHDGHEAFGLQVLHLGTQGGQGRLRGGLRLRHRRHRALLYLFAVLSLGGFFLLFGLLRFFSLFRLFRLLLLILLVLLIRLSGLFVRRLPGGILFALFLRLLFLLLASAALFHRLGQGMVGPVLLGRRQDRVIQRRPYLGDHHRFGGLLAALLFALHAGHHLAVELPDEVQGGLGFRRDQGNGGFFLFFRRLRNDRLILRLYRFCFRRRFLLRPVEQPRSPVRRRHGEQPRVVRRQGPGAGQVFPAVLIHRAVDAAAVAGVHLGRGALLQLSVGDNFIKSARGNGFHGV